MISSFFASMDKISGLMKPIPMTRTKKIKNGRTNIFRCIVLFFLKMGLNGESDLSALVSGDLIYFDIRERPRGFQAHHLLSDMLKIIRFRLKSYDSILFIVFVRKKRIFRNHQTFELGINLIRIHFSDFFFGNKGKTHIKICDSIHGASLKLLAVT